MGYAFAAGTTDGPGAFNFEQGLHSLSFTACGLDSCLKGHKFSHIGYVMAKFQLVNGRCCASCIATMSMTNPLGNWRGYRASEDEGWLPLWLDRISRMVTYINIHSYIQADKFIACCMTAVIAEEVVMPLYLFKGLCLNIIFSFWD